MLCIGVRLEIDVIGGKLVVFLRLQEALLGLSSESFHFLQRLERSARVIIHLYASEHQGLVFFRIAALYCVMDLRELQGTNRVGVRVRAVVHADVEDRRLLVISLGDRTKVHRLLDFQRLVEKLSLTLVRFCLRIS